MADYSKRLANLRSRRLPDSRQVLAKSESADRAIIRESYESRGKTDSIRYALGALQEVGPHYTAISLQEGDRIKNQLNTGLQAADIPATFEYQGSVPLNIHIRFASDIDLLVLHNGFLTIDRTGSLASTYSDTTKVPLIEMFTLRSECEAILKSKFPQAKVDTTGAKSIAISGGSLQRKVDVVPSHWHDTAAYQLSGQKHDRVVKILNKETVELLSNRPFLHMKRIEEKDMASNGGAKKIIRMLKNLKNDADYKIELSSYDIAALVWHFDAQRMNKPSYLELSLIAETQKHLRSMIANPEHTKTLPVPDGTRKIIDTPEKFLNLIRLAREVDELALNIAKELRPVYESDYSSVQKSLNEAQIF